MYEEYHYNKYWTNHCNHDEEGYICSYESIEPRMVDGKRIWIEHKIDMYMYKDSCGTEICLRYGEEPHEYMSNGNISYLCWSKQEVKKKAIKILEELGDITWIKNS